MLLVSSIPAYHRWLRTTVCQKEKNRGVDDPCHLGFLYFKDEVEKITARSGIKEPSSAFNSFKSR